MCVGICVANTVANKTIFYLDDDDDVCIIRSYTFSYVIFRARGVNAYLPNCALRPEIAVVCQRRVKYYAFFNYT